MRQTGKIARRAMFCARSNFLQCLSTPFWIVCPALLIRVLPGHLLACYPYTPANRTDVLALARTHFMYLASIDSLHPSSISHTDAHTSSPPSWSSMCQMGRLQEFTAFLITSASTPRVVLVSICNPVAARRPSRGR